MHRLSVAERRARVGVRHHLAPAHRVDDVAEVARDLVCLHATDPPTVYLSPWARLHAPSREAVDAALYEDRRLLRMLAMRRTMFVVPVEDAAILQAAASSRIVQQERRRNEQLVERLEVGDPGSWLRAAEADTLAALDRLGEATAQELATEVPALAAKVRVNEGKRYAGTIGLSSRVLIVLGLEGAVVRGRPRGTWISSQYRWATMRGWVGRDLPALDPADARRELVARWLGRFGPATEADIRWWTGWPARDVRGALASLGTVAVDLDGVEGLVLADDLEPTPVPDPWVALLPSLDATTMGWQARDWYLGPHRDRLFDRMGNAGQTIWVDGRVVGGWAIRPDGEVVTGLLEDVGRETERRIMEEAARLTGWLLSVQVVPRFPTPMQKELAG